MKHVYIEVLKPDMVVASDIISDNKLIYPKGYKLTSRAIERLSTYGVKSIRIEDPGYDIDEIVEDAPPANVNTTEEPSHFEKLKDSEEYKEFRKGFVETVGGLKKSLNDIVEKNKPIDVDDMITDTLKILQSQSSTYSVFDMLHNMRDFDDLTYTHSMNVAMICNVFAHWLGFNNDQIELVTACGMLHDIGKLKIDDAIIKKPDKLTDAEFLLIKSHPLEGYKILQPQKINEHIKLAALEHHEKCDGSGYPMHLVSNKIDGYAKIVAIADVYDAMTADRCYREGMCPFKVIEIFENEGLHKYEISYIMRFLECVVNTYIDNRVMLSDGSVGTVKWINKQQLSKPMLQMSDGSFLELAKNPDLSIVKIL